MAGPEPDDLEAFYRDVDGKAALLAAAHGERIRCHNGCDPCCVDGITVFEVEAEKISRAHGPLLAEEEPHPAGKCAFLGGDGACRIYMDRPYVCRTQGLPLRWIEEGPGGERVELRDVCPLNEEGEPVETLPPDACWTLGPFEARLAALQRTLHGKARRIALRDLW